MKKTNKEQMLPEEVRVQTPTSSSYYAKLMETINKLDYHKHYGYLWNLFLLDILLFFVFIAAVFFFFSSLDW